MHLPGKPPIYKGSSISSTNPISEITQLLLTPSTLTVNSVEKRAVTLCHLLSHKAYAEWKFVTLDTTPFPMSTDITTAPFCNSKERAGLLLIVDTLIRMPFCSLVLNSNFNSSNVVTLKSLSEMVLVT